jgi:hypothetical protein
MHPELLHQLARAELHDRLQEAHLRQLASHARNGVTKQKVSSRTRRSFVLWRMGRRVRPATA